VGGCFVFQSSSFGLTEVHKKAPKFPKRAIWINAPDDVQFKNLKGQVTLVDFWDYASINSIRNLNYVKQWNELYEPLGLQTIGVHAPDYRFAYKRENLEQAIGRMEIDYPILMDNNFRIWKKYGVFLWPTKFLINHKGKVVHIQVGEGNHRLFEEKIRYYLAEANPTTRFPALATPRGPQNLFDESYCGIMSDEIRVGTGGKDYRLQTPTIANEEGLHKNQVIDYVDRGQRNPRGFFVHGQWRNEEDYFEHAKQTEGLMNYLGVQFEGYAVFGILSSNRLGPARFYLLLDSEPIALAQRGRDVSVDENGRTYVLVAEPRIYSLVQKVDSGIHELKLYTREEGAAIHGFSFGNRCLVGFE